MKESAKETNTEYVAGQSSMAVYIVGSCDLCGAKANHVWILLKVLVSPEVLDLCGKLRLIDFNFYIIYTRIELYF